MSSREERTTIATGFDAVADAVEALSVLIDAGITPHAAWKYVGESVNHGEIPRIAAAIGAGKSPSDALLQFAGRGSPLSTVAAIWIVADYSGAALAAALRTLSESLRDQAENERDVDAALAGPRATLRLVMWMPLVGIGMAVALGIDVLGTLLGTPAGWILTVSGLIFLLAGRLWTTRMVNHALRGSTFTCVYLDLMIVALSGGLSPWRARGLLAEVAVLVDFDHDDQARADRVVAFAEHAGVPVADLLRSASRQARRQARLQGRVRSAQLSVRVLVPVGVCILPAFLCWGVAPMIVALFSSTVGASG